jgi:hypothetical protein
MLLFSAAPLRGERRLVGGPDLLWCSLYSPS